MMKSSQNGKLPIAFACAAGLLSAASAAELELAWTLKDGRVEKESAPLVEKGGALTFSLPASNRIAIGTHLSLRHRQSQ